MLTSRGTVRSFTQGFGTVAIITHVDARFGSCATALAAIESLLNRGWRGILDGRGERSLRAAATAERLNLVDRRLDSLELYGTFGFRVCPIASLTLTKIFLADLSCDHLLLHYCIFVLNLAENFEFKVSGAGVELSLLLDKVLDDATKTFDSFAEPACQLFLENPD